MAGQEGSLSQAGRGFLAVTKDTGCHGVCGFPEAVGFQAEQTQAGSPLCFALSLSHTTPASLFQNVSFCPQNTCFAQVGEGSVGGRV